MNSNELHKITSRNMKHMHFVNKKPRKDPRFEVSEFFIGF